MRFEDIWHSIQTSLKPGATIKNWTAAKGYLGDSFTIVDISSEAVTIASPGAKNQQRVPRKDFEAMHEIWQAYRSKSIQRKDTAAITRFSKYIISILQHIKSET